MRFILPLSAACLALTAQPLRAQSEPQMPPYTTNPAELPKVFAVGIRVSDMARSVRFYREGMGATRAIVLTPRETSISFPSGITINLALAAQGAPPPSGDGVVGFIFQTADIDALAKRVVAAGGALVRPPSDGKATGGVRVAFVRDPDGARIEVIQFPAGSQGLP
jgi:predicted enzyme related to lactoylglutathione lyase